MTNNKYFLGTAREKNITKHPPLGFHLSKTKKMIILDYFK